MDCLDCLVHTFSRWHEIITEVWETVSYYTCEAWWAPCYRCCLSSVSAVAAPTFPLSNAVSAFEKKNLCSLGWLINFQFPVLNPKSRSRSHGFWGPKSEKEFASLFALCGEKLCEDTWLAESHSFFLLPSALTFCKVDTVHANTGAGQSHFSPLKSTFCGNNSVSHSQWFLSLKRP
jgi:hypothetical protein